nr:YjiH family protein [Persicirhabdus sediminis]
MYPLRHKSLMLKRSDDKYRAGETIQPAPNETMESPDQPTRKFTRRHLLTFLIPSLIGIFLFMAPVPYTDGDNEGLSIPIAVLAKTMLALLGDHAVTLAVLMVSISAIFSSIYIFCKPSWLVNNRFLASLFRVTVGWYATRMLGFVFILLAYFEVGPAAIYHEDTGGLILHDLLPTLLCVFTFAGMLLPLLLNYGLLEFIGTMLTKIMRPVFRLPGRCTVDSLASWLGDGSVGVLLTSKQYEEKFYTKREAAVIATSFSAVSITFALVVLAEVRLEHMFVPFYLTVCVAGFVAAIITPRIPPLSLIKNEFIDGSTEAADREKIPAGHSLFSWSKHLALTRASKANSVRTQLKEGLQNVCDMILGVLPVIMAVGTVALVISENTPIFDYLGKPFIPLLELMRLPEAEAASRTLVVGFADMFVPAIIAGGSIESDMTRFVIAALSVTQLIYLSEVGALILGSKIPLKLWQLFIIFITRTLITLPVIILMAHLIFRN